MLGLINNFKISLKVSLIVMVMTIVTIATISFAALRMRAMADANADLVTRVGSSGTLQARAARRAENYLSSAFQLVLETTAEGNARLLAQAKQSQATYLSLMARVQNALPEHAAKISPVVHGFEKTFATCDAVITAAASTTTQEGNREEYARLERECAPRMEVAMQSQTELGDFLIASAEQIARESAGEANGSIRWLVVGSGAGVLLGLAVALWIGVKGLARPIGKLKIVMDGLAGNNLTLDVPFTERRDELGEMARAVEVFKNSARDVERLNGEKQEQQRIAAERRKGEMNELAHDFEAAVGDIVEVVWTASTELESAASMLAFTAERAQSSTAIVVAASEQAATSVQSATLVTGELTSSIDEIGRQVQELARMANEAVDQTRITNERVSELSKAASRIGDVVELINSIAAQTNLLALNATIEAARAGEAGRGFSVVASEVKALAQQTAKATGDIGLQITGIQAATQELVGAINQISGTIAKLSEISAAISAAVATQGAATQGISHNVQQAAHGAGEVVSHIVDVQRVTNETGSASAQVVAAATSLSENSNYLKLEVTKFLEKVRSA